MSRFWRSLKSSLGLGRFPAPFDLPAEMHEREQYSVLFFYTDTRFSRLVPQVAEWFKRRRIIYRLDTKRSRWAPTPVFTQQCDLDAFLQLHATMKREYRVIDCMTEVVEWLEENDILHVWLPGERSTSFGYSYGIIPPPKPPTIFRLLEDRDAVHLALRFEVQGKADTIRAAEEIRHTRHGIPRPHPNHDPRLNKMYQDQYFVRPSS